MFEPCFDCGRRIQNTLMKSLIVLSGRLAGTFATTARVFFALVLAGIATLIAQTRAPLPLKNGPNVVDVLGDGSPAQIMVARRDNGNAHGYSLFTAYVQAPDEGDNKRWQVVPFEDAAAKNAGYRESLSTQEGADCVLRDVRVIPQPKGGVEVVVATRDFGESYAASAAVSFDHYRVMHGDGIPGEPTFYFKLSGSQKSRRKHCDVNEAFDQELGLGSHGIGE